MDEATLCDRIALIQSGKILSIDTPEQIIGSYKGNLYAIKSNKIYQLLKDVHQYAETLSCYAFGEYLHIQFKNNNTENETLLINYLKQKDHRNLTLKQTIPTIEDCFIKLMTS
ncbi:hypothetical protein D3C87_1826270 [compost metagenome]